MIKISHRGNTRGKTEKENHPDQIAQALKLGFHVELDVWRENGEFYLGHDTPEYQVDFSFLDNPFFFCHCKNFEALFYLNSNLKHADCFMHDSDPATLTKKGYIWTYPANTWNSQSILVDFSEKWDYPDAAGVCADYLI